MTALSSDVTAALASLRTRWGEAAPRIGGAALGGSGTVVGALATVPLPEDPDQAPRRSPDDDRVIRTGFAALDAILGTGGIPRSAALAVRGAASSGKTTLALRLAAEAQAAGSIVAYVDLARSLDPVEAVARGRPARVAGRPRAEPPWTRPWRWPERWSPGARSISSSSTCRPIERARRSDGPDRGPDGRRLPSIADRLGRLAALARRADVLLVVLEPPGLPAPVSSAIAESAGLRLELARRSWIRLGRDVVGQRTEVVVARNRAGPPGRRADLRILYAEGGGRDACLLREPLLTDAPTALQPRIDDRATPPSPLAAPSTPAQPSAGDEPARAPAPSRPVRSSSAGSPGRTGSSSTPARRRTSSASGGGCPWDRPTGSRLKPRSSTRTSPRTRPRSSARSRPWPRSARGSPARPTRPTRVRPARGPGRRTRPAVGSRADPRRADRRRARVRSFPAHPGSGSPGRASRRRPRPAPRRAGRSALDRRAG